MNCWSILLGHKTSEREGGREGEGGVGGGGRGKEGGGRRRSRGRRRRRGGREKGRRGRETGGGAFLYLSLVIIKYKLLRLNEHVFNGCTCTCFV